MTNEAKLNRTIGTKAAQPKKRKIASLDRRKARAGWMFVLPFILGFLLIYLPILFDSIRFSFVEMHNIPGGGYEVEYVGFWNYSEALFGGDGGYVQTLISGLQQLIFEVPAILIFSLFMAVMLNQKMVGRAAFRAIFFVPVVISTGIMDDVAARGSALQDSMGSSAGIDDGSGQSAASEIVSAMDIEKLFAGMKVGTELVDYVVQIVNDIYDLVNRSGVQMLIFLAGLQSISPAIYESCTIDGATTWETFWKITFPMISPMILVNAVYTVIDSFTASSNQVMNYIGSVYEGTSTQGGDVLATAMYWIYFSLVLLIIAGVAAFMSAYVFYQRRD